MQCPECGSEHPEGQRYCADCGTELGGVQAPPSRREVEDIVREKLDGRLKEQRLVELEISQAIAERLSGWAKLFGFFVGFPLAALALILGVLGVKSYSDFTALVRDAEKSIKPKLDQAVNDADAAGEKASAATKLAEELALQAGALRPQVDQLKAETASQANELAALGRQAADEIVAIREESERLQAEAASIRERLAQVTELSENLRNLTSKVERLEEQVVAFTGSGKIVGERQQRIQATLGALKRYLSGLGFELPEETPSITVEDRGGILSAYLDGEILLSPRASIFDACFAYGGHVLNPDRARDLTVSSAMAIYFSCNLGETPAWEAAAGEAFSEATCKPEGDPARPLQREVRGWLDFLIELRSELGREATDRVVSSAWRALAPGERDFSDQLLEAATTSLSAEEAAQVQRVIDARP